MLSFRRRLVMTHWAVIVVIVSCTALGAWWQLSRLVHGQLDGALLALAETEAGMVAISQERPIRVHELAPGAAPPSLVRLDRLVQIIDGKGQVLARSANLGVTQLPVPESLLAELTAGQTVFKTLPHFSEEPLRVVSVPTWVGGALVAIQVAGSLDDVHSILQSAAILFGGMAIALLAAVGAAGVVLTRRALGAIADVVQEARRIGDSNLSSRLPHPGTPDEIGHLVDTLNDMLARLEQGFALQRRFTADASHELRSPLSRLRTEIEVTLRRQRDNREYVDTLQSCLDEVGRLTLLVEELLMLARLDAGQERPTGEPMALNALIEGTLRRMEPSAREQKIALVVNATSPASARVVPGPVSLVLANLLDNALKFSPPGGSIVVECAADQQEAVITVTDQGPGILESELPHLFDRFYRGASARAGTIDGVGLGLALSQAVVQAFGGRIEAGNALSGGAVFTVRVPLAA